MQIEVLRRPLPIPASVEWVKVSDDTLKRWTSSCSNTRAINDHVITTRMNYLNGLYALHLYDLLVLNSMVDVGNVTGGIDL